MGEKELFNFGDKELNVNSLLNNINSNLQSYLDYYSNSILDSEAFGEKVDYIKNGIKNGSITTDGTGVYYDANGKLSKDDELMNTALHFIDVIAREQSKKERTLTKSEIAKLEETKKREKIELEKQKQKEEREAIQSTAKPIFEPLDGWSVANAFAHSFNQNGLIPYDVLQQLVTTDEEGNSVYTDLHTQLDKNFDSVSKQLQQFDNTESYVNNINLFKQALKDGDLSPQDRFLGMELGFQNSELDKLNALIKYKIEPEKPEELEKPEAVELISVPKLVLKPLESDSAFKQRITSEQKAKNYYAKVMDKSNFDGFTAPKSIKNDSEEEFKEYLKKYIYSWIVNTSNKNLTRKLYYPSTIGYGYSIVPLQDITIESLQYMDPKLYNELGLKFFSNYSASKMYKHFKDLVDKQNKEAAKHEEGGILKAENGLKTPWRLNFDGTIHQMDAIYNTFTENALSYDAKQIADTLNKLNSEDYRTLNFGDKDNTLGFRNWNTTFNESGLNNLFGYNENKSDYLGVTTKSRRGFIDHLKTQGTINTGNGNLAWNPTLNQWEYTDWVDPNTNNKEKQNSSDSDKQESTKGSTGTAVGPEATDLTLRELLLKKPVNFNPDGIVNSLAGYIANEVANAKKQEIQKDIPIYLEVMAPEKAFKNAYTYDLEKAKGEIMAEANNIQPVTSDVSEFYKARNEAIKNARAYTTKLDTEINDRVHQTVSDNLDIAFENAVSRTENANTNAKYRHEWEVELKLGDVDYIEARNQSFLNLNKEIKHSIVTNARKKQKQRDAYVSKYILAGLTTNPSNYIDGWTKHHDLIWYKGQNGILETDLEQIEYQQLLSIVNQASLNMFALYENINYPGIGTLHTHEVLKESYDPTKHGKVALQAKKGAKIDMLKIGNFINKLK